MKKNIFLLFLLLTSIASAHDHFSAGVLDLDHDGPEPDEPLQIVEDSGIATIRHLLPRPVGQRCGGYYMLDEFPRTLFPLDAFSFTALSDGQTEDTPSNHPLTGSWIWMEIVSVTGPANAHFFYWGADRTSANATPTLAFATNQPVAGDNQFKLSQGLNHALADPFGHIHNRAWTADKPGDYYIGFRLVDRSTNRPGGKPWHTPSEVYTFHFRAGPSFQTSGQLIPNTGYMLTWPSQMGIYAGNQTGIVFNIERSTNLTTNSWENIGAVTGTTATTVSFTDPSPPSVQAFYRLNYLWATP